MLSIADINLQDRPAGIYGSFGHTNVIYKFGAFDHKKSQMRTANDQFRQDIKLEDTGYNR